MPVYNEVATLAEVVASVLSFSMPGLTTVLTIVESNSGDGSREAVLKFADHPNVNIILEASPGGKGTAVRKGLAVTSGDIILIQDADLEYDISDYPDLLTPILDSRADFVIGRRSSATAALRDFPDQPQMARLLNAGHHLFAKLFNAAFETDLSDPFSMFKVFRRECIAGMNCHATRFDFDWEITGKLVRRGFVPLEIPVGYRSRSYKEGKKVRLVWDPLTWLWTCGRVRLEHPDWSSAAEWVVRADGSPLDGVRPGREGEATGRSPE
jgi:glycosyltransferase involved in cell wall biosynthesis